ncbi:MAG: hypothetical protein R3B13_29100 [Polyangiaceae bacterium]
MAAGITGWVVFVYVMLSRRTSDKLAVLDAFGLVGAFEGRSTRIRDEYDARLRKAHKHIDLMGFGLRALREDHADNFAGWASRTHVRILLIDPRPHARQRDLEENNTRGAIEEDVKQFARATAALRKTNKQFEVRLYTCLPSVNVFRIDDDLFWGPYLIRKQSRNSPTFLTVKGGHLYEVFAQHFEEIWSDDRLSRPVPDEWDK